MALARYSRRPCRRCAWTPQMPEADLFFTVSLSFVTFSFFVFVFSKCSYYLVFNCYLLLFLFYFNAGGGPSAGHGALAAAARAAAGHLGVRGVHLLYSQRIPLSLSLLYCYFLFKHFFPSSLSMSLSLSLSSSSSSLSSSSSSFSSKFLLGRSRSRCASIQRSSASRCASVISFAALLFFV